MVTSTIALLAIGAGVAAAAARRAGTGIMPSADLSKRDIKAAPRDGPGYIIPNDNGGSCIGLFPNNTNGEPLNLIISGNSDAYIRSLEGFTAWSNAIGFGKECFGLHSGAAMQANLGDGKGWRSQQAEFRFLYELPPQVGACSESVIGGNHYRFWQQSTTSAWFLACSEEEDVFESHTIVPDGYDKGRDDIVSRALKNPTYRNKTYMTTVNYITGLLPVGDNGINHGITIDGRTAVLTIAVTSK
ncbi:hypothetical protein K437DRAFT_255218 [Tilletiaria anomala UBC 951]|uniref:Lytic polysaccharide monooxygenase n=1 Tax=Tilletiaria anomala (strain ATCC 24038 / CBS 436.72 / UBC 951) TaxID=1037660 RepID=A0A066WGW8_TILAU|nr:uncharacterized protein K437DRAFT_255218 [Tilletiaria anomala UBC 951]KDN49955.1 hypothetical protein K437DRAFT_255218 [Tilletiaria anomala UBC 951]